jgi:hypothetical protein
MPFGLLLVRAEFPCSGMYSPGRHWQMELLYDRKSILNALPAGEPILIGERNPRTHLERQRFQVRIGSRLCQFKASSCLQAGTRDVSRAQQRRGYSQTSLYPPVPMEEKHFGVALVSST